MIKSGRYGEVAYDATGVGTPVAIVSINAWKMSQATDRYDVTCFGDGNKVYVPGNKDISGSFDGFWNSAELTLFDAIDAPTPGLLRLTPNTTEATFYWEGLAYLDAEIDVSVKDAPKISGKFAAAATWTGPSNP